MARMDEQTETMARPARGRPWWHSPFALGLLGVALLVGGWKLSTYAPPLTPRQADSARRLDELKGMTDDSALREKLDGYAPRARAEPPYRLPGQLAMLAGLVLFVAAVVKMYRQPAPAEPEEAHQE
jgi:hypothetical protein